MKCYIFLLCFVAVPSTFGDSSQNPQNAVELDRARSAWNFGGYHPVKKTAYWNRPKNVAGPGSILANRRLGSASAPMAPYRKKSSSPSGTSLRRRQSSTHKPYPKSHQQGRPVVKRNTNFPFQPQTSQAFPFPQNFPLPYYNNQQRTASSPWNRASRKLRPRVDTIKSRFMKEDLWHLDKGESYAVKDEDLERDNFLRNRKYFESNEIDNEIVNTNEEKEYIHELEKDAEKMVNHSEKMVDSDNHTEKDASPKHIHHHHHYEVEEDTSHHKKPETHKKPAAAPNPNQVIPATLPRIHNPIPLGCLLAVPVFHPIRPRHHLACLLSIPGTPSLTRRRRRRSADFPQVQIPTQAQSQNLFQQLFGSNSRMTPIVTRKHYASHVGNGKNPNPPSPQPGNYKVPATIIAPPKFDKDDILSMLLGSGGISADKMGTIVATENRYVRYGRGLPNGRGSGTRQGRNLQWMPESKGRTPSHNNHHQSSAPVKGSSGRYVPSGSQFPQPAKQPVVHLTPIHKSPPPPTYTTPHNSYPHSHQPPLILNVQISPMQPPKMGNGPVITVPIQQQQQQQPQKKPYFEQQQQTVTEQPEQQSNTEQKQQEQPIIEQEQQPEQEIQSNIEQPQLANIEQQPKELSKQPTEPFQTIYVSPSGKSNKYDHFKNSEWMPVHLRKQKPQKAFNYEYTKINSEPQESKYLFNKMKPYAYSQEKGIDSVYSYPENIRDQLADSGISSIDSLSDYYDNSLDFELASPVDSFSDSGSGNYLFDSSYPNPTSNSWTDNMVNDATNNVNVNSISFAVKKNYKDELDNVLQDISSKERGVYSNSYGESNDYSSNMYDNFNSLVSTSSNNNVDTEDSVYTPEKYYTVKKIPDQLPDPIVISIPKDSDFSNELYDVKK